MRPPVANPSVWCGVCGRGYGTEKSLENHAYMQHRHTPKRQWFSAVDPTGKAQPPPAAVVESHRLACPHCTRFKGNEAGLKIHLGRMHAGLAIVNAAIVNASIVTQPDGEQYSFERVAPVEGNDHVPTRDFPPKSDRNNAVALADLPWMTWPNTVEQCDDALNGIAVGLERTTIGNAFWLSLRNYVAALRKRLLQKAAA